MDFIPIAEEVTFTEGQSKGDSVCAEITIIQDPFVESMETFEVNLLPDPNNLLGAIIQPSKAKAIVTISDGEMDRSMYASNFVYTMLYNPILGVTRRKVKVVTRCCVRLTIFTMTHGH